MGVSMIEVARIGEGFIAKDPEGRVLTWAHPVFGGEPGGMMLAIPGAEGRGWRHFPALEAALANPEAAPLVRAILEAHGGQ